MSRTSAERQYEGPRWEQTNRRTTCSSAPETPPFRGAATCPGARKAFEALDRSGRYHLILPLLQALTPETRKARLDKALHRLAHTDPPQ
ncbi:YdeI/OmpD-associated family protein [Streptomyces sp. NPDC001966]